MIEDRFEIELLEEALEFLWSIDEKARIKLFFIIISFRSAAFPVSIKITGFLKEMPQPPVILQYDFMALKHSLSIKF